MPLQVINMIEYARDGRPQNRDPEALEGIMIHRCGVNLKTGAVLGYNGYSIVAEFLGRGQYPEVAEVTGKQNPYTLYVGGNLGAPEYDGLIWQALPLDEIGHHARRWSKPYLGIGAIFDGRVKPASHKQYSALVDLCADLCTSFSWDPYRNIKGHGEVPGAHDGSKAPGRGAACPGALFDMNSFRFDVEAMMKETSRRRLFGAGLVFDEGE